MENTSTEEFKSRIFLGFSFCFVSIEEIKEQVIELARKGFLLPLCLSCGIVLSLDEEALLEKCITCNSEFQF